MVAAKPVQGSSFARVLSALVFLTLLLGSAPVNARYVPDTSVGPEGRIDISLRGEAELFPEAVESSIDGLGFVTAGLRDGYLAICAYSANAQFSANFGNAGCVRQTVSANLRIRQLLTGNSGYWVLLTDASDTRHFMLLRLSAQGETDASFGSGGRREFQLTCGATDTAPNCPELMGAIDNSFDDPNGFRILAETKNGKLWLLARRLAASGAYEGVVWQLDQGFLSSARANLFDALPAAWLSEQQYFGLSPVGLVAHGDGVLVKQRTNHGHVLLRVNANVAIDRAFAASRPGGLIISGDGAILSSMFHLPVVADDDTFVWGNVNSGTVGDRYDRHGQLLGPAPVPGRILTVPSSFKDALSPLWVFDGGRVGRWQNGLWDVASFGGHGPYALPAQVSSIAMASGSATLALAVRSGARKGALSLLATGAAPNPIAASLATQSGSVLNVEHQNVNALGNSVVQRAAKQADGQVIWQRIELDLAAPQARIASGTLPPLAFPAVNQVLAGNINASGQRWMVRLAGPSDFDPMDFYADAALGGQPTRRLDLASIRARMTPFIPTSPHGKFFAYDLITTPDGGASLLVGFAVGQSFSQYTWHLAQLRWEVNSVSGSDYQPQVQWEVDMGPAYLFLTGLYRDGAGGITVLEGGGARKISPQGAWDMSFGDAGRLDLTALGFSAGSTPLSASLTPGGGLWLAQQPSSRGVEGRSVLDATRLARIDGSGRVVSQFVKHSPPTRNSGAVFSQILGAGDGGLVLVSALYSNQSSSNSRITGDYRALRFGGDGKLDTHFGLRGAEKFFLDASSDYDRAFVYALGDGNLAWIKGDTLTALRLDPSVPGPSGATVPAVEYYNNTLNHYFMTADAEEITYVETGGAGPGWSRTGQSFRTYATLLDAPGDAIDICRFYGSPKPAAHSPNGRVGPNSHFYTFVGEECHNLYRDDWGWIYEGTRLALFPLLPDNSCPAGQTAVLRAYNNGFEIRNGAWTKNDANHRYSTSLSVMAEMAAKGWALEGPRFCAPN